MKERENLRHSVRLVITENGRIIVAGYYIVQTEYPGTLGKKNPQCLGSVPLGLKMRFRQKEGTQI